MKITKPKANQLLIEAKELKKFDLKVKSKTGLSQSKFNNFYESMILGYRLPNMEASKQIIYGKNEESIKTLYASITENLLLNGILDEKELKNVIEDVINVIRFKI